MNAHYRKLSALLPLLVCSMFLLSACSDKNKLIVKSEYEPVAFDSLKTYRWYKESGFDKKGQISEITYNFIKRTINKELRAKNLTYVENGPVDIFVNASISAEVRVDVKNYQVYSGVGHGYTLSQDNGFHSTLESNTETDYIYYREGTLLIDMIKPDTDKLIWRGTANKRLSDVPTTSQQEREKLISNAISAILANFPPKKKT